MCIFYSSNKAPPRAFGTCLGETVMVTPKPKSVLPEKTSMAVWRLRYGKATTGNALPVVVVWHVM